MADSNRSRAPQDSAAIVGIDVGGTHTDIVVLASDGSVSWVDKVASNPSAPLEAIRAALATIPDGTSIGLCVNGTTIGMNALLQHRLPRVGLVATRGFGDVLSIRRETKANIYDLDWRRPAPLIPRHLTFEVDERVDPEGAIVRPLQDVNRLLDWLAERELDNVAVCLLHAYRNPAHELAIAEAISTSRPETDVTLSSEVWPEWREFERTYNTALNAALKPIVKDYVAGLLAAFKEAAGHQEVYLMHADGGVLQPSEIVERPVLTLLSGTVAGALLGARVAEASGFQTAVSLDMGGTSTDIALSENGRPRRSAELSIEWEGTLGFAGVDVESIGAGGGSIAWADEAGGLHVGPMSAGASPGPASYGLGGKRPALTDAYLLLGYLGHEPWIGGRELSVGKARDAFAALSEQTGLASERLYAGVYEIANSNLAMGIRRMTIERGIDPRSCTLLCFGGAGPMHAASLVRHLGLASALIPPRPGNGSAFGLLLAPVKHSVSRTFYTPLDDQPSPAYQRLVKELRERATNALPSMDEAPQVDWYLSLRYRGQTRELTIQVDEDAVGLEGKAPAQVASAFHAQHEEEFTFSAPTEPIQLVTVRCEASRPARAFSGSLTTANGRASGDDRTRGEVEAHFVGDDGTPEPHRTSVIPRDELGQDDAVAGPAVLLDIGSTILLPPGSAGRVDEFGNLIAEWGGA